MAAAMRLVAPVLLALADRLESGEVSADDLAELLSPGRGRGDRRTSYERAADHIRANPGDAGKKVAAAAGVTLNHFYRSIAPRLLDDGFRGLRGVGGYYPPPAS
jgi:hypothetical protein